MEWQHLWSLPLGPYWLWKITEEALNFTADKQLAERIVKTPGEPFPNVAELNEKIDRNEWRKNPYTEELEGPWSHHHCVYFVDAETGKRVVSGNSTYGQMLAVNELRDAVAIKRHKLGERVFPVVMLDSATMKLRRFGQKPRPWFRIISWILDGQPVAITSTPVAQISAAEIVNDKINY